MGGKKLGKARLLPRRLSPRLIVACEGEKTEYFYFTALLNYLKQIKNPAALIPIKGTRRTSLGVVEAATQQRNMDRRKGIFSERDNDRVYAILDVEPHDPQRLLLLEQALSLARKNNIHVLLSNPSFEVWLLSHLKSAAEMKRRIPSPTDAKRELATLIASDANAAAFTRQMEQLVKLASHAVAVAREVREQHHKHHADTREANAATDVYKLVAFLLGDSDPPP